MRRSDFDVWFDKFKPEELEDGIYMYETCGDDLKYIMEQDKHYIWTLLDSDGKTYLAPGFHLVNRINYIICKNPWKEGERDYKY